MKKQQVNRNFVWAETFVNQLLALGIRNVCISPGSRSTPLTLAFTKNKKIKSFVNIDERVSGFFALGIARATGIPTALVTTSGTATAELYPAIVEAYMNRVPLIICTADRPPELWKRGANQTINQWNLYRNHIRFFKNVGLPRLSVNGLNNLKSITTKAYEISNKLDCGPVHLNFPFRKPLEPNSFTDEVDDKIIDCAKSVNHLHKKINKGGNIPKYVVKLAKKVVKKIERFEKGLIVVGPSNFDNSTCQEISKLSRLTDYPVLADGLSQLRFRQTKSNISVNYNSYLRSEVFKKLYKPEIIIQFGRTVTSTVLQEYLTNSGAQRFLINKFGDVFDPSGKSKTPIKSEAKNFCAVLNNQLKEKGFKRIKSDWTKSFEQAENLSAQMNYEHLYNQKLNFEPKVITECVSSLPANSKFMIGNSLPVRDLDNFVPSHKKNIKIYFNRGASGIDGITSTVLGIAIKESPVVLITGDLSFLHDLNALIPAVKYSIPLVVILINNNGGGIFEMLPIPSKSSTFKKYFKIPHDLDISAIVSSFGVKHYLVKDPKNLRTKILSSFRRKKTTVLEIKTDSDLSKKGRQKFWANIAKQIDREFEKDEI